MTVDSGLDIGCLRIFLETAKDCNMSRAAQTLGVSQPAVSASIKKLKPYLVLVFLIGIPALFNLPQQDECCGIVVRIF